MAVITHSQTLDLADDIPGEARVAIKSLLEREPRATRKVYAALARKVWSLLVERRFDDEIRDWHDLVRGVKARISETDDAAAERLTALGDLLRESISLAQTSPARDVAKRPRARSILGILNKSRSHVPRRKLLEELEIGSSNLSNILTLLVAHDLVERRGVGKQAEFRITNFGRQLIGEDFVRTDDVVDRALKTTILSSRLRNIDADLLDELQSQPAILNVGTKGSAMATFLTGVKVYGGGGVHTGVAGTKVPDLQVLSRPHSHWADRHGSLSPMIYFVGSREVALPKPR
ncbi:hypothetical protein [Tsuneonella suprasediminis]|uniref:hypothetical protein n=1 Tax=Tsuneonella suprasediminis TaxID=2306996 RepID=UPI002F94073F